MACSSDWVGNRLLSGFRAASEESTAELVSLEIPPPPAVVPSVPLHVADPPDASAGDPDASGDGFRREIVTGMVPDLETAYFDFDSADLTEAARERLRSNAAWLRENVEVEVQLQGHCDERGTVEYNFNLGQRRADAVKQYLSSLGIDPGRIHTISYGEERPVVTGHDEEAWRLNRRTEFHVF